MGRISLAKPINIISGIALALSILAGANFIASNQKSDVSLILGLIFGSITVSNKIVGSVLEQEADNKHQSELDLINSELRTAKQKIYGLEENEKFLNELLGKSTTDIREIETENLQISETLDSLNRNLRNLSIKHSSEIKRIVDSYEGKLREKNCGFQSVYCALIQIIIDELEVLIDKEYDDLHDKSNRVVEKELVDEKTLEKLKKFVEEKLNDIEEEHGDSIRYLKEVQKQEIKSQEEFLNRLNEVLSIQSEIRSELTALQLQYRAILNLKDVRKIRSFEKDLPNLCWKQQAIEMTREENVRHNEEIQKLETWQEQILSGEKELKEYVQKIFDELEKSKQEVTELKRPKIWMPATRDDYRMSNIIIRYFEKLGYLLDKHSSEYRGWEGEVYFQAVRTIGKLPTPKELNEHSDKLQQLTGSYNIPKFYYLPESMLFFCRLQFAREPEKVKPTLKEKANNYIFGKDRLLEFIETNPHIGFWGQTGSGKTTAIGNVLGGMYKALGGNATLRTTIPKVDESTQEYFRPDMVNYIGLRNSIFGLLEAALEIQFRIYINEEKFTRGERLSTFEPIIFFIDEINNISDRFGNVNEADLENILERFEANLSGERMIYFQDVMRLELWNYKNQFFKKLILFVWQTGRSLNVKTLVAGQNLQPSKLKVNKPDILNCAYMGLGKSLAHCGEYRVPKHQLKEISEQIQEVTNLKSTDKGFKYVGLFCPMDDNSYLAYLPEPNYYQIDVISQVFTVNNSDEAESEFENSESLVEEELSNFPPTIKKNQDKLDNSWRNYPGGESSEVLSREKWKNLSNLDINYKNLDYAGGLQLFNKLPKKSNGEVHRTKAYREYFKVKSGQDRKVYSDFIDCLEQEYGV